MTAAFTYDHYNQSITGMGKTRKRTSLELPCPSEVLTMNVRRYSRSKRAFMASWSGDDDTEDIAEQFNMNQVLKLPISANH